MKIFIISALALLLAQTARSQPSAIARVAIQAGDARYFSPRYAVTYLSTSGGYDSVEMIDSDYPDTSRIVWEFKLPRWAPAFEDEKYILRDVDFDHPSFEEGFYTRHSLVSPSTFRRVQRYRPSSWYPYQLYKVSLESVDSVTGKILVQIDTTYNDLGQIKRIKIDSTTILSDGNDRFWREQRYEHSFTGKTGWLQHMTLSREVTRLTNDAAGREIILNYFEPGRTERAVVDLPKHYRKRSLDYGPKLDTISIGQGGDTTIYTDIKWSHPVSPESMRYLNSPFLARDGKIISRVIRKSPPRPRRTELTKDTLEVQFDAMGRIVYHKGWGTRTYAYSSEGWLTNIRDDRGPNDIRIQNLQLVRNQDSVIIARVFREAKKDEYGWDTTYVWHLLDHRYSPYEKFSSTPIDRLSEVSSTGRTISVRIRDEYRATISATLFDAKGELITRTQGGVLEATQLTRGDMLQIIYRENDKPLYLQTIRLHGR